MAFTAKLAAAGVFVEFHLYPGVPHGFEAMRHIRVSQEAVSNLTKFLTRY
jgi:acetyl esterase/lipase